ncbi:hypothetical protein O6H91_07G076000 [Diphasiastrum complanatum]|uniref:Uncharacterized protein n=1 Tax=Diphasiastrum complanatum TaxID=34168 RepID=A0ACC2D702_DIPCM|nr:hypothetical protein O6H91_07G076000 [Diphasiastrum complanatum]
MAAVFSRAFAYSSPSHNRNSSSSSSLDQTRATWSIIACKPHTLSFPSTFLVPSGPFTLQWPLASFTSAHAFDDSRRSIGHNKPARVCFQSVTRLQSQGTDSASTSTDDGEGFAEAAKSGRNDLEEQPCDDMDQVQVAHDVIRLILQEKGLSREDALSISARAPLFAQKLADSANELKDFDRLRSLEGSSLESAASNVADDCTSFREYVVKSTKNLGGRFLSPFLESIGVHELDIPRICRSLSSDQLPEYFHKVCFLETVIAMQDLSTSQKVDVLIRRMMKRLSLVVDEDLQHTLSLFEKVGVRARDLGKMVVKYPWLLSQSVENNCEGVVDFLTSIKVPKGQIDKAITKYPLLLGSSSDILLRMVRRLNDLGVKSKRLGRVIAFSPQLLVRSPQEFNEVIVFLEKFGILLTEMGGLIKKSPEVFASNIEKTLQVKTSFLQELGLSEERVSHVLQSYPEVLSMSVASLKQRTDYLLSAGLSDKDVAFMVGGFPQILGYTVEAVFKPKLDFLVKDMGRSVNEVVSYPRYFSYSLEKRIKPRARVLENRKLNCDLKMMLALNDDQFACQFIGFARMLVPPIREVNPD